MQFNFFLFWKNVCACPHHMNVYLNNIDWPFRALLSLFSTGITLPLLSVSAQMLPCHRRFFDCPILIATPAPPPCTLSLLPCCIFLHDTYHLLTHNRLSSSNWNLKC